MSLATITTDMELKSYQAIATIIEKNSNLKKVWGNAESMVFGMMMAKELGFSPMLVLSGGIHIINGKFEISARLMNQAIRNRGHKMKVILLTNEICKLWGQRKDTNEEMEVSYHIEEAMRSGLIKEGSAWKKVPQDMLFARAISRLARRLYADCIGNCYVEGELQETIKGVVVESVEVPAIEEMKVEDTIALPNDVNAVRVEEYILESSQQTNKTVSEIKKRVASNIDGFLKSFRQWESKKYPTAEIA